MAGGTGGVDPLTAPLAYPGLPPQRPAVLIAGPEIFGIQPATIEAVRGAWLPIGPCRLGCCQASPHLAG
jgi:hypothetical protein